MKLKRIYILFVVMLLSTAAFSQFVSRDNVSISLFYFQKSELDSAKKYIDLATLNEPLKNNPKTWYYRGIIYKEIYKTREKENKKSPSRLVAITSFNKAIEKDVTNEFSESAKKGLTYLASTLYNDAARLLNEENYADAKKSFTLFKKTMKEANPSLNLTPKDIIFKMALATKLNRPKLGKENLDSSQIQVLKKIYTAVLQLDSNNSGANYNLAILYYNEGADIINNMDFEMDLFDLNKVQDRCIELFLKGLPYMKKSYELNYKRKETLLGLSNIYYGLNDMEKSEAYKKELQKLEDGQ